MEILPQSSALITEQRAGTLIITLNRPSALNALNLELHRALQEVIFAAKADSCVRAIVITGSGRAFCAGSDMKQRLGQDEIASMIAHPERAEYAELGMMDELGKPIIAAINGLALGGGLELAMACDIRIAAAGAQLGMPEVKWGGFPASTGTIRLPRLIGRSRALELVLTGDSISAEEAYRIGLVNSVVKQSSLLEAALAMAARINRHSATAVRVARESVISGLETTARQAYSADLYRRYFIASTADRNEGTSAFLHRKTVDAPNEPSEPADITVK